MNEAVLRRTRFIIQRDLVTAIIASNKELRITTAEYSIGRVYDYQDIADEATIAAANLLMIEDLGDIRQIEICKDV